MKVTVWEVRIVSLTRTVYDLPATFFLLYHTFLFSSYNIAH